MSIRSFGSTFLLVALYTGAATFPSSLSAQQSARDDRGTAAARVSLTPTSAPVDSLRGVPVGGPRIAPVGFTHANPASPVRPIEDTSRGNNRDVAMMGVGGAAVGLGLIIGGGGGSAIAVTGGVIGLVGLYRYLR